MKSLTYFFFFTILLSIKSVWGALDFMVLDSAQKGATLIAFTYDGAAGDAALRQLGNYTPQRGQLVIVRARAGMQDEEKRAGWESVTDHAALETRFPDAHEILFCADQETYSFDKRFRGDTVRGSPQASAVIHKALRDLEPGVVGKDWQLLTEPEQKNKIVVTTNARLDMEGGLRPAVCERELRTAAVAMLRHLSMMDDDGLSGNLSEKIFPTTRSKIIRVAVYDGQGAINSVGRGPAWLRARLALDPQLRPELVDAQGIKKGALEHADVLLIGGGQVTPQSQGLGAEGRKIITQFVKNGGGYIGICAGAYLGGNGSGKWDYLDLLPVETKGTDTHCKTPLMWSGSPITSDQIANADLSGGPIFSLMKPDDNEVKVWARFQQNVTNQSKVEYSLKGSPAVISGMHGRGKVILTSTHCERPPSNFTLFPSMLHWVAGSTASDKKN